MEDINTASEVIPLFVYSLKVVGRPGSKEHLFRFFKEYLGTRGGKGHLPNILQNYRGTYHLSKKDFWIDADSFLAVHANTFEVIKTCEKTVVQLKAEVDCLY